MAELRAAMAQQVLHPPGWTSAEPRESPPPVDILVATERYLGRGSLERLALLIMARPPMPIRELCRERVRWRRSRTSLYRQARRGARIVAARLNEAAADDPAELG